MTPVSSVTELVYGEKRVSSGLLGQMSIFITCLLPCVVAGKGELKVATPVLIREKTLRLRWELGVVTRLFHGRDGTGQI